MKHIFNLYISIISLFLIIACTPNNDTIEKIPPATQSDFQQAYNNVLEVIKDINPSKYTILKENVQTIQPCFYTSNDLLNRYSETSSISIKRTPNRHTIDTLLYIVNFENNNGFAIMSANKALFGDMIFAIADSGSISIDDFSSNFKTHKDDDYELDSLGTIINLINDYIDDYGNIGDLTGLKKNPNTPLPEYPQYSYTFKYGQWNTTGKINPRVAIKIGQRYPYNRYCFTRDGEKAVAGCVAIAITQLMSANKYPNTIGDIQVNWDILNAQYRTNSEQQDKLARIIAEIGKECQMEYGIDGFGASILNAKNCLSRYSKYRNLTINSNPEISDIETMLLNLHPIYIRGEAADGTCGHAWTIDGWIIQERNVNVYKDNNLTNSYTENRKLVHCVFGWNGTADGYYNYKLFRINSEGAKLREENESKYSNTASGCKDLENNFKIITYNL